MKSYVVRFFAILFFLSAIALGMQVASHAVGQTAAPAPTPAIPAAPAPPPQQAPQPFPAPETPAEREEAAFPGSRQTPPPTPTPFVASEVEEYNPIPKKYEDPRWILRTSMGEIRIRLFPTFAPRNVRNVVELARGEREFLDVKTSRRVRHPFYSSMIFHRVMPGLMIQTGCPFGTGRGGPGYTVADEITTALRFTKPGMVAMAPERAPAGNEFAKDSNGSQFFIALKAMPEWNDKFTIIGVVEKGLDIAEKISHEKAGPTDRPIKKVYLLSSEIIFDSK